MTYKYIGTKIITGYESSKDGKAGYGVIYPDGYTSWSPKQTFEEVYRKIEGENQILTFSDALHLLKLGKKVCREGWNGKNMFIFLVSGSTFKVNRPPLLGIYEEGTMINYHSHIDMRTADNKIVPWLCSQTDMLAEDWKVLL